MGFRSDLSSIRRQVVKLHSIRPQVSCLTPYAPRGAAAILLDDTSPEVLLSGPAGTGKSRACLEKIHALALKYPKTRALILRKTRASLSESALVTYEDKVLPPGSPIASGGRRNWRQAYYYPNGSSVVVGGLDNATRIMSTEYDIIYIQEAIEISESDWEALTTRLRNARVPFQQILADTNPDSPRHWLKRRCDSGACRILESRHEDNPTLWDGEKWTLLGLDYLSKLDSLTGPRLQRLRHGRWVQADGVVYEGWDAAIHLVDRFAVPATWPRLWSIDFGYTNPFVWQEWVVDQDDRLFRVREIYHTRRLVEDHAARIRELTRGNPPPVAILCDHDAEDRATLERHLGYETSPAVKAVSAGIQSVAERLRRAGDGRPRLFLMRDSLDQRDIELEASKRPCCTEEEWDAYIWDLRQGRGKGDLPIKENDHGLDALRYLVHTIDSTLDA